MKTLLSIIFCIILNNLCHSQVDYSTDWVNTGWKYSNEEDSIIDVTQKVIHTNDLSYLLKSTYPSYNEQKGMLPLYGLVGENFNKIEILFTEIKKSSLSKYLVKGKTNLLNTTNEFNGTITFENATAYVPKSDEEKTIVVLTGSYTIAESSKEESSGIFIGKIKMVLTTTNVHANDITFDMDMSYEEGAVRGFVGVKKNNKTDISESCIWGFLRFPYQYAKDFDIGDGEEVINIKYAKPWFNYSEKKWNDSAFYLHTTDKDKGIHTSEKEYIKPEQATWYKLNPIELETTVIEQLNLNRNKIVREYISHKELPNLNETIIIIPEIENDISEQEYKLTSHILIVNPINGEIKYHYTENSKENGWTSNAIFISEITIDTHAYKLTKSEVAFGIKVVFRSSSRPNPYSYTSLSLYIKKANSLHKVLDHLVIYEYSGEVNVNNCYASINTYKNELTIMESSTNEYFDIQLKNTFSNSVFGTNSDGDCEDVEKTRVEKTSILKYNKTKYN